MKLNKFQKVIETCSKMKEVLVFCELIADTETAPPFLKAEARQTRSMIDAQLEKAAKESSIQDIEEELFFAEYFIAADVWEKLLKAKAEDASRDTKWYHSGAHDFGEFWNEVQLPECVGDVLNGYIELLSNSYEEMLPPSQMAAATAGEGLLTYYDLSDYGIRFASCDAANRFNNWHPVEQPTDVLVYTGCGWQ